LDGTFAWADLGISQPPFDVSIEEDYVKNVVIVRKDDPDITIPFSEIVRALEEK